MADVNCCYKNKFGFCKYGNICRYKHANDECLEDNCNINICEKRHPKKCFYFKTFRKCKFGDYYRFSHTFHDKDDKLKLFKEETKINLDKVNEKYEDLERYVKHLESEIKKLQEEINKARVNNDKSDKDNMNVVGGSKCFKCYQCEYVAKTKHGLNTHKGKKHDINQLDGNISIENLENETVTKVEIVFVGESLVNAKKEFETYYWNELLNILKPNQVDYTQEPILVTIKVNIKNLFLK